MASVARVKQTKLSPNTTSDPAAMLGDSPPLTLAQASLQLGRSVTTLRRMIAAGMIAYERSGPGEALRIPVGAIAQHRAERLVIPPKATKNRRANAGLS